MTKFGVWIPGAIIPKQKFDLTHSLGTEYVRETIYVGNWPYYPSSYNQWISNGYKVVLNLNWLPYTGSPIPFLTASQLSDYKSRLNNILDTIVAPDVIVIENEECSNYSGPISNYTAMLQAASEVIHARGLKLTHGGQTGTGLNIFAHRWLKANVSQTAADQFAVSMTAAEISAANTHGSNPGYDLKASNTQAVFDAVKLYCDYPNIHVYEVLDKSVTNPGTVTSITPHILEHLKNCLETYTGLPIMTNETGVRDNTQYDLVNSLLTEFYNRSFQYVIYNDSDDNATGLNDQTYPYTLRGGGEAFVDFMRPIPVISPAGPVTIAFPQNQVSVTASGSDKNNAIVKQEWTKISGSGIYTITSPNTYNTSFVNLVLGTYVFRLTLTDAMGLTGYKDFTIIVSGTLVAPVADAGGPYNITTATVGFTVDSSKSYDDKQIVSREWMFIDGPNQAKYSFQTINGVTSIVNITGTLVPGTDTVQVVVKDEDGLTGVATAQVIVTYAQTDGFAPGGLHGKKFLYYLIDSAGNSYYRENGIIKTSNLPKPLDKTPDGWQSILLKWERNMTYWGINRNVSNNLSFVSDGAAILRHIFMTRTIEEVLYLLIQRRELDIDDQYYAFVYRLLYKGAIDLSQFQTVDVEDAYKVSVNIAENNFSKFLKAYESVVYEIPCDSTTGIPVLIDGPAFSDKFNFEFLNVDITTNNSILPTVFLNSEGDNFGIIEGDQQLEEFPNNDFFKSSTNYIFSSALQAVTVRIQGQIGFVFQDGVNPGNDHIDAHVALVTNLNQANPVYIIGAPPEVGEGHDYVIAGKLYDFDVTIDLLANERLFIAYSTTDVISIGKLMESSFSFSFSTRLAPTVCYCRRPLDVFKELVSNMSGGTCTAISNLLEANKGKVLTCGDAIRGIDAAKIKITFSDFFKWASAILAAGVSYDDKKNVEMEARKKYFDNSDPIDLGIVRKVKISFASDLVFNTLKTGYPDQNYDTVNGKQEYNTTAQFSSPITRVTKELDFVSPVRADAYGIEGIRKNYKNLDVTSAPSDNNVFMLDIEDLPQGDGYYHLRRDPYDSISGLDYPETAYNLNVTPGNILRINGDFIRSLFLHFDDQYLTYQTLDKNPLLSVTKGGSTITENANVKIGDLAEPYFIPIYVEFECDAPDLPKLLKDNPNRCFTVTYENGNQSVVIEGFNMSIGVAPNDNTPQSMKLLLSTNNDISKLI